MDRLRGKLSYANVMATIAVFLALGGGTAAVALSGKNSVKKDDIAKGAVRSDDIAANAVQSGDVAGEALTAADLATGSVAASELLDGSVGASEIGAGAVGTTKQAAVPAARVGAAGTTSVPASTATPLSFTSEASPLFFDPLNMRDPSAPAVLTVPESGVYLVTFNVTWVADDTATPGGNADQGFRSAQITTPAGNVRGTIPSVLQSNTESTIQRVSDIFRLQAGDQISNFAFQENVDSSAIDAIGQISVIWVGPSV